MRPARLSSFLVSVLLALALTHAHAVPTFGSARTVAPGETGIAFTLSLDAAIDFGDTFDFFTITFDQKPSFLAFAGQPQLTDPGLLSSPAGAWDLSPADASGGVIVSFIDFPSPTSLGDFSDPNNPQGGPLITYLFDVSSGPAGTENLAATLSFYRIPQPDPDNPDATLEDILVSTQAGVATAVTLASAVPEPSTWSLLLAIGLTGTWLGRMRRQGRGA
jgi:hypothetical protein